MAWIIFDADNTLWDVEVLYDTAREEFCDYAFRKIEEAGHNNHKLLSRDLLDKLQRQRDVELYRTHGYSSSRFARSFEDTLTFLYPYAPPEMVVHVRALALQVFEKVAPPMPQLLDVVKQLVSKHSLAIITAGERWVQEKRLREFSLQEFFSEKLVVERKTSDVFASFCKAHTIDPGAACVVGDSVRSDIRPALHAGLKAIHVQAPNWTLEQELIPDGAPSVRNLLDVLPIVERIYSSS